MRSVSLRFAVAARTTAGWETNDPKLNATDGAREFALTTDTGRLRFASADGEAAWSSTAFVTAFPPAGDHGDVTVTGETIQLRDATVSNAKLAPVASGRIKGRYAGGPGPVEDLTGALVTQLLSQFSGAEQGVVPASGGGTERFLGSDGWKAVAAGAVPASATATGTPGTIRCDAGYLYVCVAANSWKRVALASW